MAAFEVLLILKPQKGNILIGQIVHVEKCRNVYACLPNKKLLGEFRN